MGDGLESKLAVGVDVARAVVAKGLGPTAGVVVSGGAVECAVGVELMVEQSDAAFDATAARVQPITQQSRTWPLGIGLLLGVYAYPVRL